MCLQDGGEDQLPRITPAVARESTAGWFANDAHNSDRVVRAQRLCVARQVMKASGIGPGEAYDMGQYRRCHRLL